MPGTLGHAAGMLTFAVYLHPHTCHTSKPSDQIRFVGHAVPHFSQVRQELEKALGAYSPLPVRRAEYSEYFRVHTAEYLNKLRLMALDQPVDELPRWSIECTGFEYCLPGYVYGLGGMLEAIDQMKAGTLDRAYCFSLGGHHAYADWGHGYCILNPLATAVRYAQGEGFERVLIVDWDLHHGDGTQSIFAHDPTVYCLSIHSISDLYMASIGVLECGTTTMGNQVGQCNVPLLHKFFPDDSFEQMESLSGKFYRASESLVAFRSALEQIPWQPDLITIFSGYDSHGDESGRGITDWGNQEYKLLTRYVLDLARQASCPVMSVHGGGYKLPVTIAATLSHVEVLASYQ
jgi:acetoin utilization deacetylase AcuC-like enzyme